MTKKLRAKFIKIALLSIGLVLLALLVGVNCIYYVVSQRGIGETLDMLVTYNGAIPEFKDVPPEIAGGQGTSAAIPENAAGETDGMPSDAPDFQGKWVRHGRFSITQETKYETRFFTVTYPAEGDPVTNVTNIAAVTSSQALAYADAVMAAGRRSGHTGYYYYQVSEDADGSAFVVFLDCNREVRNRRTVLWISLAAFSGGFAAVALMILLLSRRAIRPFEENDARQKQFVTDASHELKTPITIISANLGMIGETQGESEWLSNAESQTKRLTRLVERLVRLSKLDETAQTISPEETRLDELLQDVLADYALVAEADGKRLEADIPEPVTLQCDVRLLRQLCAIFLDNALKYTSDGGTISVSLKKRNRRAELRFENPCAPITQAQCSHLFDRFYRVDASRNQSGGGYGIGLSIARTIVEAHRGSVSARTRDGKDVEFQITLPAQ